MDIPAADTKSAGSRDGKTAGTPDNDCILASLRFEKQSLHTVNELMFVDWAQYTMTGQWPNHVGKFMTAILCESAKQSTPWSRGDRLTLPHSWTQPKTMYQQPLPMSLTATFQYSSER